MKIGEIESICPLKLIPMATATPAANHQSEARQQAGGQITGHSPGIPLEPDVSADDDVEAEPDRQRGHDSLPDAMKMPVFFPGASAEDPKAQ